MSIPCPLCGRNLTPAPVYRCFYCNNPRAIAHYFEDHENNVAADQAISDGNKIGAGVSRSKSTDKMSNAIWAASEIDSPAIKDYLVSRFIPHYVPRSLRYHPSLAPPNTYQRQPTMVAQYANSDAIHRTFLTSKSRGTLGILPDKPYIDLTRFRAQDIHPATAVIIGEGIETTLSYSSDYSNVYRFATTTANVRTASAPDLPPNVNTVVLLMDNDDAGRLFVKALYDHYTSLNLTCTIAVPLEQYNDFNDQLQAGR